jgi:hypothetical protein
VSKTVKIKAIGRYNGHSIKPSKSVDLGLKFTYEELPNYIKLIQMLNENVTIAAQIDGSSPQKVGMFTVKEIKVDHDGEGSIKFNSMVDYVEADVINELIGVEQSTILFKANIQDAEGESDDE